MNYFIGLHGQTTLCQNKSFHSLCFAVQEFADNLEGRGIHGAVLALDPSFDTDAMAKALGIPNNKHMLHRHLYEEMKSLAVTNR